MNIAQRFVAFIWLAYCGFGLLCIWQTKDAVIQLSVDYVVIVWIVPMLIAWGLIWVLSTGRKAKRHCE